MRAVPALVRRFCSLALSALALAAAGPAGAETVLRTVPSSDLKIIDPIWTTANITRNHGYMVYDTLFAADDKGQIKPQMVDKFTASSDNRLWTLTLRPGLKFHDGTPVTAQDVVASLARWGKRDALGQRLYAALDSISAEGPQTVRLAFKKPFGVLLEALGKSSSPVPFIMPRRVAETPADRQIDDFTGSGPFTLAKDDFRPGDRAIYRKFAGYQPRKEPASGLAGGKVVKVDRVEWVFLRDPQTQANALLNGEVDMTELVPATRNPEQILNDKIELLELLPAGAYSALFNHKQPPFNHPKARRAAMLAVNQEALLRAQVVYRDYYKPCASVFLCGSTYASDGGFFTGKPQFEEARRLLKESGYDGKPVLLMLPGDAPALNKMPVVYGELLKQVGFNVTVQSMDWATLITRRARKDPVEAGGWSIFITAWGGSDIASPISFSALTGNGDDGFFGWPVDEELESLKTQFIETADLARRKALAARIQTRALEGGVIAPLGEAKAISAVRRGAVSGLLAAPAVPYWNVEKK